MVVDIDENKMKFYPTTGTELWGIQSFLATAKAYHGLDEKTCDTLFEISGNLIPDYENLLNE